MAPHARRPQNNRAFLLAKMATESHSFNVELAEKIGLKEAIILSHINFLQKNFCPDGDIPHQYKIRRTTKAMASVYSYLTPKEIRGALDRLEKDGYLIADIDNENKFDRAKSYSISSEGAEILGVNPHLTKGQIPFDKRANVQVTKGQMLNDNNDNSLNNLSVSNGAITPDTHTALKENTQRKKESSAAARHEKIAPHTPKDVYNELNKQNESYGEYFRRIWVIWNDYAEHRKEMKIKPFASAKSEALAVVNLYKMSAGNFDESKKIVEQSRALQWRGLFKLKVDTQNPEPPKQITIKSPQIPILR